MGWDPKPRALVAAFGFNDRLMWDGLTDPEHASLLSKRASFLGRNSRLFYCLELAIEGSLKLLEKKPDRTTRRVPPELFMTEAKSLIQDAKARGVPVIFLFWPRIEWMKEEDAGHPYADVISELADGTHAIILDLAEAFRQNGGETLYLDGIHPKPEGHRIAADALVEILE
jgi:hypothetical protein